MSETSNTYDEVPYESRAFPQTHPDRLATIATVFGLEAPSIDTCRVLELGCAGGGNLIPMACYIPGASFVGVDSSIREVQQARETISALRLDNIRVEHASIMDVGADWGEYDYIICHGVYSWVEPEIQEKILQIAGTRLTATGVGYISYNTYPGWHLRESIRHMMRYHVEPIPEPGERIAQARALLDFLADSVPQESGAYGRLLHDELNLLRRCGDWYVYHEHLEQTNSPLYFHQFVERAERHGLQFLAEAELASMLSHRFPDPVAETLERLSPDLLHLEQYMDFVRNRRFRQTLLCGADHRLRRTLSPQVIETLSFAAPIQPEAQQPSLAAGVTVGFGAGSDLRLDSERPATKAALIIMGESWPAAIHWEDLAESALERAATHLDSSVEAARRALAEDLFQCALSGAVELHRWSGDFVTDPSPRPKAHALTSWQASRGGLVVNKRHETVALDPLGRALVALLDGRRERRDLLDELLRHPPEDLSTSRPSNQATAPPAKDAEALALDIDEALRSLARCALLAQ